MDLSYLPSVNAGLNAVAGCFLVAGYVLVRRGHVGAHKWCMLIATGVSTLFLVSYVAHHAWRSSVGFPHRAFAGTGWLRWGYYFVLVTHIPLAMAVPVFALRLIWLGVTDRIAKHRRLARVAFPVWVYVSVTGVVIYAALYWYTP